MEIGVDAALASRVSAAMQRNARFVERVFTPAEREECAGRPQRWASRWAAKEAIRKLAGARGESPLPAWREIEVLSGGGAPTVRIRGVEGAVGLSLTHEGDLAVAVAVSTRPGSLPLPADAPAGLRLPDRPEQANKGSFGTVVVLAGSHAYSGAAYLAAMGAARGGAGLVRACVPASLHPAMAVKCTEVMPHGLPDDGIGVVGTAAVEVLLAEHLPAAAALVAGPGLGRADQTGAALDRLLGGLRCPAVLDADALNLIAAGRLRPARGGGPVVVTPHPAEMGRLAGIATDAVQADRTGTARGYAEREGAVVVLKGAATVVAAPDGRLFTHPVAGVVALASGGTGDVLAGLCGAMLAGGLESFDAAVAAVCIHLQAGLLVQAAKGRAGGLASDLLELLPVAQEGLRVALESRR